MLKSITSNALKALQKLKLKPEIPTSSVGVNLDEDNNKSKKRNKNMVLPLYEQTIDNKIIPLGTFKTIYQQTLHGLNSIYHYFYKQPSSISLQMDRLTKSPFDVKKIVIIGIHGWFPSKIFNPVIGEPVGTSEYISNKMYLAVFRYFKERLGVSLKEDDVQVINLECQGKVEDRVESHYQQLMDPQSNWSKTLRDADMIIITAHSQG